MSIPAPERKRRLALAMEWHPRLIEDQNMILGEVQRGMDGFALSQSDIPLIVKLIENPAYDLPFIDLFDGATDLWTHDHIHILLGRGLRPRDEAFVLGFTMGSTDRVGALQEFVYTACARWLFPSGYRFSKTDARVFRDAVRLGYISDCKPLSKVNYHELRHLTVREARLAIGLEVDLLEAYFRVEQRRYPHTVESDRLI